MSISCKLQGPVVAWLIKDYISNDVEKLKSAIHMDVDIQLITEAEAKFMGMFDLGIYWERLAALNPVFTTKEILGAIT